MITPCRPESPVHNPIVSNLKTTGLAEYEYEECDDLSHDSNDMYAPLGKVCTPSKHKKLLRKRESDKEQSTSPNPRMARVHEADPVLDIAKIGGDVTAEILFTKQGARLEVFNQTSILKVGM